jgi:homocitrate synthase NifV
LRDGEQGCGIAFSVPAKLKIATLLYEAGIREMETGVPASYPEESLVLRILTERYPEGRFIAWNRMNKQDILKSLAAGANCIHISVPVSRRLIENKLKITSRVLLEKLKEIMRFTLDVGVDVLVGAEDASRAEEGFLIDFMSIIQEEGVKRVRYADTVGCQHPSLVKNSLTNLLRFLSIPLEYHAHNDLGLATANALAAVEAGAAALSVTVSGIGERAGNAALEQVATALKLLFKHESGINLEKLPLLCETVAHYSGRPLNTQAPLVGKYVFSHESGIHVDGLLKDPGAYTFIPPELLGRVDEIIPGKNSGTRALKWCAQKLGYELDTDQLSRLRQLLYTHRLTDLTLEPWHMYVRCLNLVLENSLLPDHSAEGPGSPT